jgi:hypothetical protein
VEQCGKSIPKQNVRSHKFVEIHILLTLPTKNSFGKLENTSEMNENEDSMPSLLRVHSLGENYC